MRAWFPGEEAITRDAEENAVEQVRLVELEHLVPEEVVVVVGLVVDEAELFLVEALEPVDGGDVLEDRDELRHEHHLDLELGTRRDPLDRLHDVRDQPLRLVVLRGVQHLDLAALRLQDRVDLSLENGARRHRLLLEMGCFDLHSSSL